MSLTRRIIFGRNPRRTAVRVLALAAVAFITFTWLLTPIRTEGISMEPTYRSDSFNLVNRSELRGSAQPARGDVVAIRLAGPSVVYVKRIVGLPGERVASSRAWFTSTASPLHEPYVSHRRPWDVAGSHARSRASTIAVGDNRGMQAGSHKFGTVDRERILGKVLF